RARSLQLPRAQTSISLASRSPTRRAVEQRSVQRSVTSIRYLRDRLTYSTLIQTAAPASIQVLPATWQSLTVAFAHLARRSPTPRQQAPSPFSSSTMSPEILFQWPGRPASTTIFQQL